MKMANQSAKPPATDALADYSKSSATPALTKRDRAITALIQMTRRRSGLNLLDEQELGFELVVWRDALKSVPDKFLRPAFDHAADNWDWHVEFKPFTVDALLSSYKILVVEDRQRREAALRNAVRADPESGECRFCCNTGYQAVFVRQRETWQQVVRACACPMAPITSRSLHVLAEPEYLRDTVGRYARRDLVEKFGAPANTFQGFIVTPAPKPPENPNPGSIASLVSGDLVERLKTEIAALEAEAGLTQI